ncbi:DUF6705 family protein [Flavobacterium sp. MK4S-17]|uniref:DUF6705 family protein n=1 Tax=Flavobacterium sp. MK4S-17 TaxID=2543737 RepID=UPI0013591F81|nr:DUF6705 family protein [Flavobacterium sp. MK4S-17]
MLIKINIFLLLFIASQYLQAQTPPVLQYKTLEDDNLETNNIEKGDYYRDVNNVLDRFTGTWQYQQDNTIFTLKIRKVNQFLFQAPNADFYIYQDILLVNYKLIKNNTVLVDELDKPLIYKLIDSNNYNCYFRFIPNEGIYGTFIDLTNRVYVESRIKKLLTLAGEPQKIHFLAVVNSNTHRGKPKEFYEGMSSILSIPGNVELVKIE